jgi:hypothetical protein
MTTYEVKPDPVPAATGALTTAEVTTILARLDGAALQTAGAAQTQLGRELATMAAHLAQEAGTLTQNWSGVAARTALAQLQRLHQQTATLATQTTRTGAVLTWLGTQVLPALNHPATPTQARQFLTHLTTALIQADTSLPAQIGGTTSPASHSDQGNPTGTPLISGLKHPASQVSSLQSAAPVPNAASTAATTAPLAPSPAPSSAPTPVPSPIALANVSPATGTTAASSETPTANQATSEASPDALPATADVAPGTLAIPVTPAISTTATRGRTTSPRDPDDHRQAQPLPATTPNTSALPGVPSSPVAAPAPKVSTSSPALTARPLPELPTLDSGLSGGALPLPPQPVTTPAITPVSGAPAIPSFLPPAAGVPTPPNQERHRQSWATEDRNPWALPTDCVSPLIEGA